MGRHHPPMGYGRPPITAPDRRSLRHRWAPLMSTRHSPVGAHCPADEHWRWAPTGERARWERSAPDERLELAPDAPSSPVRSPQNLRPRRPSKRLPSPRPRRLGPPSKPELRPRRGRCQSRRSLLSRFFLHPRTRCLRLHSHPPRRLPAANAGGSGRSLASSFLAGRPIQCDDPDALAANQ
jgi:hypothetical protein